MQLKLHYLYSEGYMSHAVPDARVDFRFCIVGAGILYMCYECATNIV